MTRKRKETSVPLDTRSLAFVQHHIHGLGYEVGQHMYVKSKQHAVSYSRCAGVQKRYVPLLVLNQDNIVYDLPDNVRNLKPSEVQEIREKFLDMGFDFEIVDEFPWEELQPESS